MTAYIAAFGAAYLYVFLKSFQQISVVNYRYAWIMPVSYGMAATEALIILNVAEYGWGWIVLAIGTGAGLGAMTGMKIHEKLSKKLNKTP